METPPDRRDFRKSGGLFTSITPSLEAVASRKLSKAQGLKPCFLSNPRGGMRIYSPSSPSNPPLTNMLMLCISSRSSRPFSSLSSRTSALRASFLLSSQEIASSCIIRTMKFRIPTVRAARATSQMCLILQAPFSQDPPQGRACRPRTALLSWTSSRPCTL